MDHADAMRRCLIELDVAAIRGLWAQMSPHLPQPQSDADALVAIHMARTSARSVPMRLRAYSHCWLRERGYPSQLPDHLKPRAERMYPRAVGAVGISVNSKWPLVKEAVHGVMRDAVLECYADQRTEPEFVKARMLEARQLEMKGLGLIGRA